MGMTTRITMHKTLTTIMLSSLLLTPFAFAQPQQQTVSRNINDVVNGQKTHFIFKDGDDESGQLIIQTLAKQQAFDLAELPFERKRQIHFQDYNFDGFTDIAVSTPDMGMGVYSIFDIFLYQPKSKDYQVLNQGKIDFSHAQCSGLTDLKLITHKKQMTSSCRGGARWWIDTYQFKNGQWKWLKSKAADE